MPPNGVSIELYLLNIDTIQKIIAITIITAMIPTTAPALNMPPTTAQPLMAIIAMKSISKFSFFIVKFITT